MRRIAACSENDFSFRVDLSLIPPLKGVGNTIMLDEFTNPTIKLKEKLFEDNSVRRVAACSENDFSFRVDLFLIPPLKGVGNTIMLDEFTNPTIKLKEKLFEDNSVSGAGACSENDFSFRVALFLIPPLKWVGNTIM